MRRHCRWWGLAILCGLFSDSVHAADPAPLATRFASNDRGNVSAPATPSAINKGTSAPVGQPKAGTQQTFGNRMQAAQQFQLRQQQADNDRPKPTTWQLQNPANPQNNSPTEMTGTIAANNYFGSQFHDWSNISPSEPMTQLPFNQSIVPTINQSNLSIAPNSYYGGQFSDWSNLSTGQPTMNPFGGWNYP